MLRSLDMSSFEVAATWVGFAANVRHVTAQSRSLASSLHKAANESCCLCAQADAGNTRLIAVLALRAGHRDESAAPAARGRIIAADIVQ